MAALRTYDKGDALPAGYRQALIRLMAYQADSEYAGAQRIAENLRYATRHEEAYRLGKKIFEETGHAYAIWNLLQDLGVDVDARLAELVRHPNNPDPARVSVINTFRKANWAPLFECWEDVALYSLVVTPATVVYLDQYQNCSYLPWARVNVRIHKEEHGHLVFGVWAANRCLQFGDGNTRDFMQGRVARFTRRGLGFFGRPSQGAEKSRTFDTYYELGLKVKKPEELQAEYLALLEPRLREAGLEMPSAVQPDYLQADSC